MHHFVFLKMYVYTHKFEVQYTVKLDTKINTFGYVSRVAISIARCTSGECGAPVDMYQQARQYIVYPDYFLLKKLEIDLVPWLPGIIFFSFSVF